MALLEAAVGAGLSAIGQGIGGLISGKMNKKQRQWLEKMYKLQRTDALADWNMQNQYNAPSQQMERLKAAGLNPNLVYESNPNVASAQVRQSDTGSYKPDIPQVDGGMIANAWINARQAALQRKQTEAQIKALDSQQKLQDAQALESNSRTANNTQDLTLKKSLMKSNIEAAELQNQKMANETRVLTERNEREAVMQSSNLREAASRIALNKANTLLSEANTVVSKEQRNKIIQEVNNLKIAAKGMLSDNALKEWEVRLSKEGLSKNDPLYVRQAVSIINKVQKSKYNIFESPFSPIERKMKEYYKNGYVVPRSEIEEIKKRKDREYRQYQFHKKYGK